MREPNAVEFFDAVIAAASKVSSQAQLDDKVRSFFNVRRKQCGRCQHWMKRGICPRETGSAKTSPDMNTIACDSFLIEPRTLRAIDELRTEIVEFAREHGLELPGMFATKEEPTDAE